jgi:hypothetical protein
MSSVMSTQKLDEKHLKAARKEHDLGYASIYVSLYL